MIAVKAIAIPLTEEIANTLGISGIERGFRDSRVADIWFQLDVMTVTNMDADEIEASFAFHYERIGNE